MMTPEPLPPWNWKPSAAEGDALGQLEALGQLHALGEQVLEVARILGSLLALGVVAVRLVDADGVCRRNRSGW